MPLRTVLRLFAWDEQTGPPDAPSTLYDYVPVGEKLVCLSATVCLFCLDVVCSKSRWAAVLTANT